MNLKQSKIWIKQGLLLLCLIILTFQFSSSFHELTTMVKDNSGTTVSNIYNISNFDLSLSMYSNQDQVVEYVKVDTLYYYTYKLLQTILLLFGIFTCLIFLSTMNRDYSWIESVYNLSERFNK